MHHWKIITILILLPVVLYCSRKQLDVAPETEVLPDHESGLPKDSTSENPASTLASASLLFSTSKDQLKSLALTAGFGNLNTEINYGTKTYRVEYYTTFKDRKIKASGLLHIPDSTTFSNPVLSIQHGTLFKKTDAPSLNPSDSYAVLFASTGYITLEPDYIGFGSSSDYFHPYYDKEASANGVIDFIHAVKEFLINGSIPFQDSVFLAGYSEGGYVTMAAFEKVATDPSSDLNIKAVAAGAGGYELSEMLSSLKTSDFYPYPAYLAYIILSFDQTYDWNHAPSYYFASPYHEKISSLFDGTKSGSQINSELNVNLDLLLNPRFYENLKNNGETLFNDALINNSVTGFYSSTPMRLYHGTADEIIPYSNSELTYHSFQKKNQQVKLIPIPGGTHGTSFKPMLLDMVSWFKSLR